MVFNSLTFMVFIAIFFAFWPIFKRKTATRLCYIFAASTVFYGWWDWRFLFLIYFTGSIDFILSLLMGKLRKQQETQWRIFLRKCLLTASLLSGLGVLAIFKYSKFFADELSRILLMIGFNVDLASHIPDFCLILPVGISFYTFQSLSYTIDVYRGRIVPTRSIIHYFAYLMLFPQLVAGPIVRAVDLLPKLLQEPFTTPMVRYTAIKLILLGFFKKCVLADNIAPLVDTAYANVLANSGTAYWWLVMVLFAIQIYCDFSGYSDIARGIAKMMGFRFALNFNHPYIACGIKDFWRRWHISLSSWFKDYVYIPLGGNRSGKTRMNINLAITFILSGLWHGAAANFILWGVYHAIALVAENICNLKISTLKKCQKCSLILLTQIIVIIGWVFFRTPTIVETKHILCNMFSFHWNLPDFEWNDAFKLIAGFVVLEIFTANALEIRLNRLHPRIYSILDPIALGVLAVAIVYLRGDGHGFIYFQF